jgi:hypothetical protein
MLYEIVRRFDPGTLPWARHMQSAPAVGTGGDRSYAERGKLRRNRQPEIYFYVIEC